MATCFSILAWRIPGTEEPGGLQSIGSQRVRHDRSDLAYTHTHTHTHTHTPAANLARKDRKLSCVLEPMVSNAQEDAGCTQGQHPLWAWGSAWGRHLCSDTLFPALPSRSTLEPHAPAGGGGWGELQFCPHPQVTEVLTGVSLYLLCWTCMLNLLTLYKEVPSPPTLL